MFIYLFNCPFCYWIKVSTKLIYTFVFTKIISKNLKKKFKNCTKFIVSFIISYHNLMKKNGWGTNPQMFVLAIVQNKYLFSKSIFCVFEYRALPGVRICLLYMCIMRVYHIFTLSYLLSSYFKLDT